jgi:uncharacterized membrane protein
MTENETTAADVQRAAAANLEAEADSLAEKLAALRDTIVILEGLRATKRMEAQHLRDAARDADQREARLAAEFREARHLGSCQARGPRYTFHTPDTHRKG